VPDALHVAVAWRLDAALVTLDRHIATAARELRVNVATPKMA
jgi:predicted nucleic acid-binding protein